MSLTVEDKSKIVSEYQRSPGDTGSAGHGPLWQIYVVMNEGDERYKIHIAKIESWKFSAQRTADAIAKVCRCPVRHKQ